MEYVWEVASMTGANIASETNVIINVQWVCTGTDEDGYSGFFQGGTPLNVDNINPATFVPYDQLTQALVLSWVQPIVENNAENWQAVNERIMAQITYKKENINPDIPLPWNPTPSPTPPAP